MKPVADNQESINIKVLLGDKYFRNALFKAHGGRCFYTGRKIDIKSMHVDHIRPSAAGGEDTLFNLVPTSANLNIRKGARMGGEIERMIYINATTFAPAVFKMLTGQSTRSVCWYCGKVIYKKGHRSSNYCSKKCMDSHLLLEDVDIEVGVMNSYIDDDWDDSMVEAFKERFFVEIATLISAEEQL